MKKRLRILKERVNVMVFGNKFPSLSLEGKNSDQVGKKSKEQEELHYTAVFIEDASGSDDAVVFNRMARGEIERLADAASERRAA